MKFVGGFRSADIQFGCLSGKAQHCKLDIYVVSRIPVELENKWQDRFGTTLLAAGQHFPFILHGFMPLD